MAALYTQGVPKADSDSPLNLTPAVTLYITDTANQFFNINIGQEFANITTSDYDNMDYDLFHSEIGIFTVCLFIILSAIVLVIGLVGNCLVCFAVWRNPRMRSATNIFLVNLAVADFLVILICLPPTMAEDITGIWYLGKEMCKIVKCLQVDKCALPFRDYQVFEFEVESLETNLLERFSEKIARFEQSKSLKPHNIYS